MQRIRAALSTEQRGDQSRLALMRCVNGSTVSQWRTACRVLDAVEGKVQISELSRR
jgi:hypothetical protein